MFTKTKTINKKKDDLETNHSFSIPKHVQNDINEKWFHIYNWIWEKDVKQSIERDFLKLIDKLWPWLAALLIIPSSILLLLEITSTFYWYFFWLLWIINLIFLVYVLFIAIKRSSILRKNAYVLITDSSVSINWKIDKLSNTGLKSSKGINKVSTLFEENIFEESNIEKTKKWFFKKVTEQLWKWFTTIMKMWRRWGRDSWKVVLLLLVLYSIYAFSLWIIYFIWIFFIWIFWNILSFVNKKILLISWHEITTINNHFENIDKDSKELIKEKNTLSTLLTQAMKNDWKDSLLTKINSWIKNINNNASDAVDTSIKLKRKIESSKYKEMFNFSIYNSWIKKQIHIPLKQILDLLQKNLDKLNENKEKIEKQILETSDQSLQWPLVANKARIQMRIKDIRKHMKGINIYIIKLK